MGILKLLWDLLFVSSAPAGGDPRNVTPEPTVDPSRGETLGYDNVQGNEGDPRAVTPEPSKDLRRLTTHPFDDEPQVGQEVEPQVGQEVEPAPEQPLRRSERIAGRKRRFELII